MQLQAAALLLKITSSEVRLVVLSMCRPTPWPFLFPQEATPGSAEAAEPAAAAADGAAEAVGTSAAAGDSNMDEGTGTSGPEPTVRERQQGATPVLPAAALQPAA